jgi:sugar lactone lactonase YvrE
MRGLTGLGFPESLRWRDGALWFSDMFRGRVVRWMPGRDPETVLDTASGGPGMPGGLGWLPDGSLLVVDCHERRLLRIADGHVTVHADLTPWFTHHANDCHVDADGTAWVGGYGFDPESDEPRASVLVRVSASGDASPAAAPLVFPNGCERRSDGALVVAETFADRIAVLAPDASARVDALPVPEGSGPDGLSLVGDDVLVALAFAGSVARLAAGATTTLYRADAGLGCYDVAVNPVDGTVAVAIASLDEAFALREDTGRVILLPPEALSRR